MLFLRKRKSTKRHLDLLRKSVLFDAAFYRKAYAIDPHVDAERHFYNTGWKLGFDPSPYFNTAFYLSAYDDVKQRKVNPLVHYLMHGGVEMRRPLDAFDVQSYGAAHPELAESGSTPAEHCIQQYGSYAWSSPPNGARTVSEPAIESFRSVFDKAFYLSHNADVVGSQIGAYEHFVYYGQFEYRDPAPNFDTFFATKKLAKKDGLSKSLLDRYHQGQHDASTPFQNKESLLLDGQAGAGAIPSLCVHVHCFYPELIREMIPGFQHLPASACIVVTVVSAADAQFIAKCLARHAVRQEHHIRVVPNRGRDIAPFLVGCQDIWRRYDVVLHLHTKVSTHVYWGSEWRHYLLDQTIGSKALVDNILDVFAANPKMGCLYPRNFYRIREFVNVENNNQYITLFMRTLGFDPDANLQPDYPAGSMAWYRTDALSKLADALTDLDRFEEEADQVDLTFAHALERILTLVVRASGFQVRNYITPRRARLIAAEGLPHRESSAAANATIWPRDTPRIARMPPRAIAPVSRSYNPRALDVHWVLPSFSQKGAGGHMTIFRMVEFLERFGHRQTLWFQNAVHFADQAEAKRRIQQWYRPIGSRVHVRFLPDDVRQIAGDVVIATDCWTAYPVAQVTNVKERFYLIQDYEPLFHAVGDLHLLADETYNFGFANLCAGNWLLDVMESRKSWARAWDLCADHEVYYPGAAGQVADRPIRIAFHARQYTPRRAVALGFAAFELLHKRGFKFVVDLFGEEDLSFPYDFPHVQRGIMEPAELGELYRSCDIGLVFSATNYSLIPLEMMACGLPVVEVDTESTRAIFKNGEVSFARPMPYSIADAIEVLASDPERRAQQRERGFEFTRTTSWERSARAVERAILERLAEGAYRPVEPDALAAPAVTRETRATVFIPTYNAGPDFARVLEGVTGQACDFDYDVLIIDSGSSDETVDLARRHGNGRVRVESIAKGAFQHGRTRNLGIERSRGDYVAVITQDACPKDRNWLSALIGGFARGPRVAGVIGRHAAYPEHDPFTRRDMEEMFDGLALLPDVVDRDTGLPSFIYPGGQSWGMHMHFYSDNNSAMSRAAWKILPYPEVDWGEDQVWAEEALRLGFQKAYVDEAVVYHSHAFDLKQQYAVSTTEGRFWAECFGIDLHPNPDAAIAAMNDRDSAFALQKGIAPRILRQRHLQNRATVQGRRTGYELGSGWTG